LKLVCNDDELNDLVKLNIVEPQGNGKFKIYTKANLKGETTPIDIDHDNVNVVAVTDDGIPKSDIKTIDGWLAALKNVFPTNSAAHLEQEGRNLRTGNKLRLKKRIQALIDESYNMDAVLMAAKYEVWFRKKTSTVGNNSLDFMQGMEAWLNNTSNIDAMIDRAQQSKEFKNSINEPQGTKRKVKLS
jgi:hypothetical protein